MEQINSTCDITKRRQLECPNVYDTAPWEQTRDQTLLFRTASDEGQFEPAVAAETPRFPEVDRSE